MRGLRVRPFSWRRGVLDMVAAAAGTRLSGTAVGWGAALATGSAVCCSASGSLPACSWRGPPLWGCVERDLRLAGAAGACKAVTLAHWCLAMRAGLHFQWSPRWAAPEAPVLAAAVGAAAAASLKGLV